MRKVLVTLCVSFALLISGCGTSKGARIISVKTVDKINTSGGVSFHFEGKDIIEIVLDFGFDKEFASGLDSNDVDTYRKNLYKILIKEAHLFYEDQEVEQIYGYWPKKAGSNYAKSLTLFYTLPQSRSVQSLKFVYDGSVLGKGAAGIDKVINP